MSRNVAIIAAVVVAIIASVAISIAIDEQLPRDQAAAASLADKNEFMFQVDGYESKSRPQQTTNLYFNFRYDQGIADADIPDYRKMRTDALAYLDGIGPDQNVHLEILNKTMCAKLKAGYPIEAISCQMQVLPKDTGISPETGLRRSSYSSIFTIGDIAPINVPAELFGAPSGG